MKFSCSFNMSKITYPFIISLSLFTLQACDTGALEEDLTSDIVESEMPEEVVNEVIEGETPEEEVVPEVVEGESPEEELIPEVVEGETPEEEVVPEVVEGEAPEEEVVPEVVEGETPEEEVVPEVVEGETPEEEVVPEVVEGETPDEEVIPEVVEEEAPEQDFVAVAVDIPNPKTLWLSGTDTNELNDSVTLTHYAYRNDVQRYRNVQVSTLGTEVLYVDYFYDQFLFATNGPIAMDYARLEFDEFYPLINAQDLEDIKSDSVTFYIANNYMEVTFNINGGSWNYSRSCAGNCTNILFNESTQAVDLSNIELMPAGGNATDTLTISGDLSWVLADENPNNPPYTNTDSMGFFTKVDESIAVTDIAGLWEFYTYAEGIFSFEQNVYNVPDELFILAIRNDGVLDFYYPIFDSNGDFCYLFNPAYDAFSDQGNGIFTNTDGFRFGFERLGLDLKAHYHKSPAFDFILMSTDLNEENLIICNDPSIIY